MQPGQQGTRSYRAFPARLLVGWRGCRHFPRGTRGERKHGTRHLASPPSPQSELRNIERTVGLDDVGQPSVMNAGQETPLLWEQELGRLLSSFMGPRRGLRGLEDSESDIPSSSSSSRDARDLQVCRASVLMRVLHPAGNRALISTTQSCHRRRQSPAPTSRRGGGSRAGSRFATGPRASTGSSKWRSRYETARAAFLGLLLPACVRGRWSWLVALASPRGCGLCCRVCTDHFPILSACRTMSRRQAG